ncbi:MAG: NTP transferase domain-containing protein [Clostridiales bacterium]|nr:NTP transferase domain-containing protein [Clostridiales bacterium]
MNAIILAGESKTEKEGMLKNKALIKIKGKYMLEYVLDTVIRVQAIKKIVVVGNKEKLKKALGHKIDYILDGTDSIVDNAIKALELFPNEKEALLLTCDIPMITVEALEHFLLESQESGADLAYCVVNKKLNDEKYPEVKRTYVKLKEGQFTGGNVFYLNPEIKYKVKDFFEVMLENRKNPAKMAQILGIGFLLKLAMGVLTIDAIKRKVEKLLNIKATVVISPYPEIGNDVDKQSDIEFVEKYI